MTQPAGLPLDRTTLLEVICAVPTEEAGVVASRRVSPPRCVAGGVGVAGQRGVADSAAWWAEESQRG